MERLHHLQPHLAASQPVDKEHSCLQMFIWHLIVLSETYMFQNGIMRWKARGLYHAWNEHDLTFIDMACSRKLTLWLLYDALYFFRMMYISLGMACNCAAKSWVACSGLHYLWSGKDGS